MPNTSRRAAGLLGPRPIKRTRRLFLLLALPCAVLVVASAPGVAPVFALVALWVWWQQSCRRQRMPWWGDPAEFALVLAAGVAAGAEETVPLLVVGVLFRSLFTGTLRTAIGVLGYGAAHVGAAALGAEQIDVAEALHLLPFLAVAGGVMHAFAQSMLRYDALQEERAAANVEHLAYHDRLTGLPNRARLEQRLASALAADDADLSPVALILLDLDDFKQVNDSLGHALGDRLLGAVADRLRAAGREGELLARLGGDEFAVLLRVAGGPAEALGRADALLAVLSEPLVLAGRTSRVAASAGVWLPPGDAAATSDDALRGADLALYRGKAAASGAAVLFRPEMHVEALAQLRLEDELRTAVEQGQLVPHFQPLFRLDGTPVGVEALVRWEHPTRGLLAPGAFLDAAERTGLLVEIGRQMLHAGCAHTAVWAAGRPADEHFGVGVNIAAEHLADPSFCDDVERALAVSGLPPERLVLELTETAMMDDLELAAAKLTCVRALGVKVAVDDFGTGYSSLAYLRRLPLDFLKIAREFVAPLDAPEEGGSAEELARGIAQLAHSLGLFVIAEGVETQAQQEIVAAMGCDAVQGFLHARPLAPTDVPRALTGSNHPVAPARARL